jgi:hypothetical protein
VDRETGPPFRAFANTFTAEEVDDVDTKAQGEPLRVRE